MLSRRQFIHLSTGAAVSAALYGCSSGRPVATSSSSSDASTNTTGPPPVGTAGSSTSTTVPDEFVTPTPATTVPGEIGVGEPSAATGRTLVVVQLNGGNDALNTLIPSDGRYHDARPTLAIPDGDVVALLGNAEWGLHPSLASLASYWEAGSAAFLPGIGFDEPDHSHFVSLDRWWRADNITSPTGWLGRSVAPGGDPGPLYATALGSGAPLLRSDVFQAAVILQPSGFVFPADLPASVLARMVEPPGADQLTALAQRTLGQTIESVDAFAALLTSDISENEGSNRNGGLDLANGLDLAARLVTSDVGARIVVVSVGGFDTHSNQLTTHAALLADLAAGIDVFMSSVAAAGAADRTLLVTTSEFGRRVGENASGGFDHGAGGLSMMFGPMVNGGVLSEIDLGDQLDGDVRPTLDPRTMYTACLDWLDLDAATVLGERYDEVSLLR